MEVCWASPFHASPVCQSNFSTAIDNVLTEDGLPRFRRLRNDIVHVVPGSMQTMP